METITKFIGTREGNDWLNVAVLTCGHEHPGHEKGERLPVGAEVQCGLCEAGDKRPRPHLPTGGTHAAASMTPEARSERARKAAMARHGTLSGPYAVVDRFGYVRNETSVQSAHESLDAAKAKVRQARYRDADGTLKSPLMVIRARNGEPMEYGDIIYMDTVGTLYECVA